MKNKKQVLIGLETERNFIDFIEKHKKITRNFGSASVKCGISIMVVPTPRSDRQLSSLCSSIFFATMNPNPIKIGDR